MKLFSGSVTNYAKRLERELADVRTQRDDLSRQLADSDQALLAERAKAKPTPTSHLELATALQRVLPSVTSAAGFAQLRSAPDASAFAQGILSLLQTARAVGRREALEPHPED